MRVFMSPTFIKEVRKLLKSKDHADCEQVIIESIYNRTLEEVIQGGTTKKLGGGPDTPFVRRRMQSQGKGKSAGYRLYLWAFKIEDDIYLLYIHPKTGRRSAANISPEYQKELVIAFKKLRDSGGMIMTGLSRDGLKIMNADKTENPIFK